MYYLCCELFSHLTSLTKAIFNKTIQKRFLNYSEKRELKKLNQLFPVYQFLAFSFGNTAVVALF